mmetsp:Transcript_13433/g.28191  ORF Transcript_13433/g.28191 Transcript_13433/m.28191 type:complete len:88 (+) Transcript_13433:27-290(+)
MRSKGINSTTGRRERDAENSTNGDKYLGSRKRRSTEKVQAATGIDGVKTRHFVRSPGADRNLPPAKLVARLIPPCKYPQPLRIRVAM